MEEQKQKEGTEKDSKCNTAVRTEEISRLVKKVGCAQQGLVSMRRGSSRLPHSSCLLGDMVEK